MMLIQGYLFRQIALPVTAACAALAGIGILSQSLDQLEVIVERGQSVWVMARLTLLATPQLLAVILPIGLFVGALIALTRLQREQELTAAYAAGLSRWAMIAPAARLAVGVMLISLFINLFVQPWAQREARAQTFAIRTDLAALLVEEGQFVQGPGGLTVYVQQVEQNGLMENLFIYLTNDRGEVTTWDASEARFGRAGGVPVLTMQNGSMQRYSSAGVLNYLSFDHYVFDLSPFTASDERVRYKPADLWLSQLFNPRPGMAGDRSAGELIAEGHSRLASPLYAPLAMAMALAAILGGAFSRTGYAGRIAKASALFLLLRIVGYGLTAASAWNAWLNVLQYAVPLVATGLAMRLLFRALKPRRRRVLWPAFDRFKARFA